MGKNRELRGVEAEGQGAHRGFGVLESTGDTKGWRQRDRDQDEIPERSTKGWKQRVREYPGIFGVLESREEPEQQWGGSSLALGKHLVENRDEKGEGRGVW